MRGPRLLLVAAVLMSVTACSVTVVTPTPTRAPIPLPGNGAAPATASSAAAARAPAAVSTPVPARTTSPTPTWVLRAPLPTLAPLRTATATPVAAPVQASQQAAGVKAGLTGRLVIQKASGGDIVTVNADGSGLARVASGLDPAWSPDGSQIAFASWDEPQGIYVMSAGGSNLHRVYAINKAKSPVWSPDGTQIAFTWLYKSELPRPPRRSGSQGFSATANDFWRVSVVNLATGNKTDLPLDPDLHAFAPDWGPDGRVAYTGMRGIFVTDQAGPPVQITRYPLDATPAWSPDGTRIALAVRLQDHWDIAVMNANGSGLSYLTSSPTDIGKKPVNNVAPAWSPNGESIAFLSDREGDWRIYVMNSDGSNQRKLLDIPITYDFAGERVLKWSR